MTGSLHIEKLHRTHAVEQFSCGQAELDRFLTRHALQAQQANSSQTYVAVSGNEIGDGQRANGTAETPHISRPGFSYEATGSGVIVGDAWHSIQLFPDRTFRCCVTSPPYWGLRDYGIPGQIGAEQTLDQYVANLKEIFQKVKKFCGMTVRCG